MKYAVLKYSTLNIGDDIQSLALASLLPRIDLLVDRDDLSPVSQWDDDVRFIVNGWFAPSVHRVWPPVGNARCLFLGIHATEAEVIPRQSHSPIGCRDPWTLHLSEQCGVQGWLSWCATLCLLRPNVSREDRVLLVDVPEDLTSQLPSGLRARAERITHTIDPAIDRWGLARELLNKYARAEWVITTRLHALLPCAAMGTPVVFIRPAWSEHRYHGYTHFGWSMDDAPWSLPRPRFEQRLVQAMAAPFRLAVERFIAE
jgi:hypothetical protein